MSTFNVQQLRNFAIEFERLGNKYAQQDEDIQSFMVGMGFVLDQAKRMEIKHPLEHVPGAYDFTEGELRGFPDLQNAYAKFANRLQRDDESYKKLQDFLEERRRLRGEEGNS